MTQPRAARPTVRFIDEYCDSYKSLFPEVRSFEAFKQLHVGIISDIKRKSLPEIAKVAGLENYQALHHFISESPWSAQELRERRLELILIALAGQEIIVVIDETGDRKKGKKTDYVSRQYIGNLGKVEQGIVAVTAYGIVEGMTVVLSFEVYKPRTRLKKGESYRSKPQIAAQMLRELKNQGFKFSQVLNETWNVMTKIPNLKYHQVGNLYGLRNWVEYGLKQTKNELGWADFRLTNYTDIEKWWEIVCSAYLLVSLHSQALPTQKKPLNESSSSTTGLGLLLAEHRHWDGKNGWKNLLNNLRLILEPFVAYNRLKFWLKIFPIAQLALGLNRLMTLINRFPGAIPNTHAQTVFHFSSA
jgi:SRSO17 transposase